MYATCIRRREIYTLSLHKNVKTATPVYRDEGLIEDLVLLSVHRLCYRRYCNKIYFFRFKSQANSCFSKQLQKNYHVYSIGNHALSDFVLLLKEQNYFFQGAVSKIISLFQICKNVLRIGHFVSFFIIAKAQTSS